jgi:diguanylate cyclase (GGDEF)-like protein
VFNQHSRSLPLIRSEFLSELPEPPLSEGLAGTALLIADVDCFKAVNDTYGHLLGDKVLRAVAHVLQANIKGRDVAARIGGEEFAVLLPQTTLRGATVLAEQIRCAVAEGRIRRPNGELIGAVTTRPNTRVAIVCVLLSNAEISEQGAIL